MHKLSVVAATIVLLTACGGVTEKNYAKKFSKEICKASESCQAVYFNEYYSSISDCVDTFEGYIDDDDYYEDCDLDRKAANSCLATLRKFAKTCDYGDYENDDCYDMWDCK